MPAIAAESISIPVQGGQRIDADLRAPDEATGLIVFAHGSGAAGSAPATGPWPNRCRVVDSLRFCLIC